MFVIDKKVQKRVDKGAQLLDETYPTWASLIDTERLDIRDECRCVLGQVYGSYSDGLDRLFGEPMANEMDELSERHGFDTEPDERDGEYSIEDVYRWQYRELTRAWANQVEARTAVA